MAMIAAHDAAHPNDPIMKGGNGQVSLSITRGTGGEPGYEVENYDPRKDTWAAALDGTLLMDFYNDCIKRLVEAVQDELTADPEEKNALVGPTMRRWISLVNLFVQLFNHENGRFVFLSQKEHEILKKFYERLQQLLRSKTFCAMFEGDRFPDYPFPETGLSTIFGKGFHSRLRLTPDGKRAYTCCAADNTINVFDLAQEELVAVVEMPAGEGARVVDVAFAPDGATLYAITHLASGDTVFGVADITAAGSHTWRPVRVLCGVQLTVLAGSRVADRLYAVGKGAGMYLLDPSTILTDTVRPTPRYGFNAAGHLSLDEESGHAYASANPLTAAAAVTYTQVVRLELQVTGTNLNPQETINLVHPDTGAAVIGTDNILMIPARAGTMERLCVVTRPWNANDQNKHLLVYTRDGVTNIPRQYEVPKTFVSLDWHTPSRRLLVGLEDHYALHLIDVATGNVTTERHPVQISPVAIAGTGNAVYVLNYVSNTISVIPGAELETDGQFLETLADYRDAAIAAYWGLAGGLLQYLKDCFCHHLLVRCHECEEDDKVYLAGIQITENKIYKICNFSKRKYVKSFPTVEYWLSLIPVMPLFKKLVERFCCMVLPDLFQTYYHNNLSKAKAGKTAYANVANKVESAQLRQGIQLWQGTSFKNLWSAEKKGLNLYTLLARDAVINRVESASFMKPGLDRTQVLNTPVDEAQQRLESQGVQVESVKSYDRSQDNLKAYTGAPLRLNPGSKVTLYEQEGTVLYYTLAEEQGAVAGVSPEVRAEIADLERRKSALGDVAAVAGDISAARAQLEGLRQAREAELSALSELEARRTQSAEMLTTMRAEMETLRAQQQEISLTIARERPIRDVAGVDPAMEKRLTELGVRTVNDLATVDINRLTAGTIDPAAAKVMIGAAQARLKSTGG
jgi:predicted flap endonuclease-1-like 5' DNA nuclease